MNVRLTPHRHPQRTLLYSGVEHIVSDGDSLMIFGPVTSLSGARDATPVVIQLRLIAEIALDEDGAFT